MTKPKRKPLLKAYISRLRDDAADMPETYTVTRQRAAVLRMVADDLECLLDKRRLPLPRNRP